MVGLLLVAWLGNFRRMDQFSLIVTITLGVIITAFASLVLWLTYALLFLVGAGVMIVSSTLTSLVQLMVPTTCGRVTTVYLLASRGGMPLGSLIAGYVASPHVCAWFVSQVIRLFAPTIGTDRVLLRGTANRAGRMRANWQQFVASSPYPIGRDGTTSDGKVKGR